ncbi:unnamed protein product [Polarella glacialis]|uniref:Uncharacterized protein n=1 Tax=Polarella glacialis TaxID=89957 RepID=A0A813F3N2_POLGL|nr:unnamed protein product [Polarella glacialis]
MSSVLGGGAGRLPSDVTLSPMYQQMPSFGDVPEEVLQAGPVASPVTGLGAPASQQEPPELRRYGYGGQGPIGQVVEDLSPLLQSAVPSQHQEVQHLAAWLFGAPSQGSATPVPSGAESLPPTAQWCQPQPSPGAPSMPYIFGVEAPEGWGSNFGDLGYASAQRSPGTPSREAAAMGPLSPLTPFTAGAAALLSSCRAGGDGVASQNAAIIAGSPFAPSPVGTTAEHGTGSPATESNSQQQQLLQLHQALQVQQLHQQQQFYQQQLHELSQQQQQQVYQPEQPQQQAQQLDVQQFQQHQPLQQHHEFQQEQHLQHQQFQQHLEIHQHQQLLQFHVEHHDHLQQQEVQQQQEQRQQQDQTQQQEQEQLYQHVEQHLSHQHHQFQQHKELQSQPHEQHPQQQSPIAAAINLQQSPYSGRAETSSGHCQATTETTTTTNNNNNNNNNNTTTETTTTTMPGIAACSPTRSPFAASQANDQVPQEQIQQEQHAFQQQQQQLHQQFYEQERLSQLQVQQQLIQQQLIQQQLLQQQQVQQQQQLSPNPEQQRAELLRGQLPEEPQVSTSAKTPQGTPVARLAESTVCHGCGQSFTAGALFCSKCGASRGMVGQETSVQADAVSTFCSSASMSGPGISPTPPASVYLSVAAASPTCPEPTSSLGPCFASQVATSKGAAPSPVPSSAPSLMLPLHHHERRSFSQSWSAKTSDPFLSESIRNFEDRCTPSRGSSPAKASLFVAAGASPYPAEPRHLAERDGQDLRWRPSPSGTLIAPPEQSPATASAMSLSFGATLQESRSPFAGVPRASPEVSPVAASSLSGMTGQDLRWRPSPSGTLIAPPEQSPAAASAMSLSFGATLQESRSPFAGVPRAPPEASPVAASSLSGMTPAGQDWRLHLSNKLRAMPGTSPAAGSRQDLASPALSPFPLSASGCTAAPFGKKEQWSVPAASSTVASRLAPSPTPASPLPPTPTAGSWEVCGSTLVSEREALERLVREEEHAKQEAVRKASDENECECHFGAAAVGRSCLKSGLAYCSQCEDGYHMVEEGDARKCEPALAKTAWHPPALNAKLMAMRCAAAAPAAVNSACTLPGSSLCNGCDFGWHLSADKQCAANGCTCANGNPFDDTLCAATGSDDCASCDAGFNFNGTKSNCTDRARVHKLRVRLLP